MIPNLTIHEKLRMGEIKRWHMVSTTRQQTLAEHSYGVMLIAVEIAKYSNIDPDQVMKLALFHDIDEVRTGDLSPPAKYFMRQEGFEPNDMVASSNDKNPRWDHSYIVKAADFIESILFIEQHGIGKHAEIVCRDLIQKFEHYIKREVEKTDKFLADQILVVYSNLQNVDYRIWDNGKN